jgi:hypothetical protein
MGNDASHESREEATTPGENGPPPQQPGLVDSIKAAYGDSFYVFVFCFPFVICCGVLGQLVNGIIRPPRSRYHMSALGPTRFIYRGRRFIRSDIQLKNSRGLVLECSHWEPAPRMASKLPCVIYMHGNAGCRLSALEILAYGLASGLSVFAMDCAGSGKSEGDWVSLGFFERDDLAAAVDHLQKSGTVSEIGFWGRSMVRIETYELALSASFVSFGMYVRVCLWDGFWCVWVFLVCPLLVCSMYRAREEGGGRVVMGGLVVGLFNLLSIAGCCHKLDPCSKVVSTSDAFQLCPSLSFPFLFCMSL